MKKLIAFILTFAMVLTFAIPTAAATKADPKIKLDDAIKSAKTILDLKTDNYNFNYNYTENQNNRSEWDLSWNPKAADGSSIYVSIDSVTGDILNYNCYTPYNPQAQIKIPKYTKAEALAAVEKFLNKIAPTKFKETVQKDNPNMYPYYDSRIINQDTYSFNYVRQVNGLDFFDNGMTVTVDKNTLQIRNYTFNWDNGVFEDPAKAISKDKAKEFFKSKLGIELSYNLISNDNGKTQTPILVYSFKNGNNPIDAITGDVLNNSGIFYSGAMDMAMKSAAAAKANVALTPQEQSSVDDSSKYISKDAAIAEAKKYITIGDKFNLNGANLYVNSTDKSAMWYLNWDHNSTGTYSYASANVDAVTGKIKSFSMNGNEYYPSKDTAVSYNKDQAKAEADKFLSSIEPDKFKVVELKDLNQDSTIIDNQSGYNFAYIGKINGATCNFDTFNITVNPYSGKIMSYSSNWTDVTLPPTDGIITLDEAYNALYKIATLNLRYVKSYINNPGKPATPQIKLAYSLDGLQGQIDGKTGVQIDYNGKPIIPEQKISYTDIKGNASENDINTLIDLGIIDDSTNTFSPDNAILQKDFIKLLVKALPNNYVIYNLTKDGAVDYDSYYNTAIQKNILTESQKSPDSKVTRQDAAKFIIRAMGLGYLANNSDIFVPAYKDAAKITKDYRGYAAIAGSINLLPAADGAFDGSANITRGQSASTIVNFLKVDTTK